MYPRLALLGVAFLLAAAPAWSQGGDLFEPVAELHLDDVNPAPGGRRVVEAYVRAVSRTREPVELLGPKDIKVLQDNHPVQDVDIEQLSDIPRGFACVIALDVSRSMMGDPFDRAKAAASEFAQGFGPLDHLAVVSFASRVQVVAPFSAGTAEAQAALGALQIDQSALNTVFFDGVARAVELLREDPSLPRRRFVVVFSDGEDDGSSKNAQVAIETAQGSEGEPRIPLYTIGHARFGGSGLDVMRKLAKGTAGEFFDAGDLGRLPGFFKTIGSQIRRSYVLTFPGTFDGARHEVEVRAEGQSDHRAALYPKLPLPWWWMAAPLAGILLLGGLLALWLVRRSAGRLVFVAGARVGEVIALRPGVLQVGAIEDNDVVIPSGRISRYHARLVVDGSRVEIEDLGSTNGTEVNDERIQRCRLRPGDRIALAREVELEYQR